MRTNRQGGSASKRGVGRLLPLIPWAVIALHAAGQDTQVYVQDSPAAVKLLESAMEQLDKEEPAEAARLVQQLIEQHGSKLLQIEPGRYVSARRIATDRLSADAEWLSVYRELYEPVAAGLLSRAGNEAAALREMVARFTLTDSGLAAALRLAGLALEAGRPDEAVVVLEVMEKHPGMEGHRAQWLSLLADAAALAGRSEAVESRLRELAGVSAEAAEEARGFIARLAPPTTGQRIDPLEATPDSQPRLEVLLPLWSNESGGIERFLLETFRMDQAMLDSRGESGGYLNTIPYLAEERLYINDGMTAEAIEPVSGLRLWKTELIEAYDVQRAFGRYPRNPVTGGDLSLIAADSGKVVAIGGYSGLSNTGMGGGITAESRLVCLDARTGRGLWSLSPADFGQEFMEASIYGRPLIAHGAVYVAMRARRLTQFEDGYILAVDLATGRPRWVRHLASAASTLRATVGRLDHALLADGRLYIDSGLGTIARLSAADGSIDWLIVTAEQEGRRGYGERPPWRPSAPVLTAAGLLCLDPEAQRVRLIDPATGATRRTIVTKAWENPEYLISYQGDVLAIGDNVVRLEGETLDRLWSYDPRRAPAGRAVVVGDTLWAPLGDRVNRVDLSTGREIDSAGIEGPANLLVREEQVIATHRNRVASYGDLRAATERLERRYERDKSDPLPLLALAWLAYNNEQPEAMLSAVDRTVEALGDVEADDPTALRFFDQVLGMARDKGGLEPLLRSELFDRLALIAATPDQHVAYRMNLADLHESLGRVEQAVEVYQSILSEPQLRRLLYRHESGSRQAALEAEQRLKRLITEHGEGLYATYEAFAAERLGELAEQADPAPLIELADAYPLAGSRVEALALAAERAAAREQVRLAASCLRRAIQEEDDPEGLARLYGRLIDVYEDSGNAQRARQVLRSMMTAHPVMLPIRDGSPVDPVAWMEELNRSPSARLATVRVSLPLATRARTIRGEAGWQDRTESIDGAPGVIVCERKPNEQSSTWTLQRPSDLSVIWSTTIEGEDSVVLRADSRHIWIVSSRTHTVWLLDAATGTVRWVEPNLDGRFGQMGVTDADAMEDPQVRLRRERLGLRVQAAARPAPPQPAMFAAGPTAMAVADRAGRLVVLDAEDGRQLWAEATQVVLPRRVLVDESRVIIAGSGLRQGKPLVVIYELETGAQLYRLESPGRQGVRWAELTEDRVLLFADEVSVTAFDLQRGQELWMQRPGEDFSAIGNANVWLSPTRMVIRTDQRDLIWISLTDGRVVNRTPLRDSFRNSSQRIHLLGETGSWFLVVEGGVVAFDEDGVERWRDAAEPSARFDPGNTLLTDRYLLTISPHIREVTRRLFVFERDTGRLAYEATVELPQALNHLIVSDGKLLLAGSMETAVIEGAPER